LIGLIFGEADKALDAFLNGDHGLSDDNDYNDATEAFDFCFYKTYSLKVSYGYSDYDRINLDVDDVTEFFKDEDNLIDLRFGRLLVNTIGNCTFYHFSNDNDLDIDEQFFEQSSFRESLEVENRGSYLRIHYLTSYDNHMMPILNIYEERTIKCFRQLCCRWVPKEIEPRKPYDVVRKSIDGFKGDVSLSDLYAQIKECKENMEYDLDEQLAEFSAGKIAIEANEELKVTYEESGKYHYTLYYYDRAGNLATTVPPRGVDVNDAMVDRRSALNHSFKTEYAYNSLGQMMEKTSPDEDGDTKYYYNDFGQLRFSQNPQQEYDSKYSYTIYDDLGRVIEVGEAKYTTDPDFDALCEITYSDTNPPTHKTPYNADLAPGFEHEITFFVMTVYGSEEYPHETMKNVPVDRQQYKNVMNLAKIDKIDGCPSEIYSSGYTRHNLQNRINYVIRDEDGICRDAKDQPIGDEVYDDYDRTITYYSYDLHGNVDYIVQNIPVFHKKMHPEFIDKVVHRLVTETQYRYDLISGKVNKVEFCNMLAESYKHKYEYDEMNRLIRVETSRFGNFWETDAQYFYYPHGPLRRIEMGEDQLQGLDYTYTINGWLKAVNNSCLSDDVGGANPLRLAEPGKDGVTMNSIDSRFPKFPKDAFGYVMNYNKYDFKHLDDAYQFNSDNSHRLTSLDVAGDRDLTFPNLYNGNIAGISYGFNDHVIETFTSDLNLNFIDQNKKGNHNLFQYDVLNRLLASYQAFYDGTNFTMDSQNRYNTNYDFDASGNILNLGRNSGNTVSAMDNLTYNYIDNTNQLEKVIESVDHGQTFEIKDINHDFYKDDPINNGFEYDKIGNLVKDENEEIKEIHWTPDGKVRAVDFIHTELSENNMKCRLEFVYDAMGNRVKKTVIYGIPDLLSEEGIPQETFLDPCCDDDALLDDRRSLIFDNTYYARGANGKVKAVYDLYFEHKTTYPDDGYEVPFYFRHESITANSTEIFLPCPWCWEYSQVVFPNFIPTWRLYEEWMMTTEQIQTFMNSFLGWRPKIAEWYIYGNGTQGRFGSRSPEYNFVFYQGPPDKAYSNMETRDVGLKKYELTDHLGNPRLIFSDRRTEEYEMVYIGNNKYEVQLTNANSQITPLEMNNYFPFGMLKEGMTADDGFGGYRYGFNGMEKDDELKGKGNSLDFGARINDPRLGRWLSLDPLQAKYVAWTPYNSMANNPIYMIDPDGRSTITANDGTVLDVIDDGEKGVFRSELSADYSGELPVIDYENYKVGMNGLEYMGETEYWDEFREHDIKTGEVLDKVQDIKIDFGEQWEPIIKKYSEEAKEYDLGVISVMLESTNGGVQDIKVPYKGQAKLLNGYYASERSAGNYLAGVNAANVRFNQGDPLVKIEFYLGKETFLKCAGTLHYSRNILGLNKYETILALTAVAFCDITGLRDITAGVSPLFGEIPYAYRMYSKGWDDTRGVK
jgi:RHS repeat-associated protein